jgi:hypothetical protein
LRGMIMPILKIVFWNCKTVIARLDIPFKSYNK